MLKLSNDELIALPGAHGIHSHVKPFWGAGTLLMFRRLLESQSASAADKVDAERYRWLRDKSEPGACAFYLSVGMALHGVTFQPETVDSFIDAARTRQDTDV